MTPRAAATAVIVAVAILVAGRALAGPPSGYRCGSDGAPVIGQGCRCAPDKVAARDADDNAICVPRPPRPRAAPPAPPPAPAPARAPADPEARCRAGDAAACTTAGRARARG